MKLPKQYTMKIFSVIRNYDAPGIRWEHTPFGGGDISWYMLPDSSISRTGNPVFVPDFSPTFQAYPSLAIRIGRLGKSIAPRFASRYIESAAPAFTIIGAERLDALRSAGDPWDEAVAFDRSCLLGNFDDFETLINYDHLNICSGIQSIEYDSHRAALDPHAVIAAVSARNTLKNGDLILAAVSPQPITLNIGDCLTIKSPDDSKTYLEINIR